MKARKIRFPARGEFHRTVRRRVERYFAERGLAKTGNWRMLLKTAVILASLPVFYVLLVFFSSSLLMAAIAAFGIAQGFVLIGFNIMHDSNHGSYSKSNRINRALSFTMDLIGGSHLLWRQKHNVLHHTYTNINELDSDLHTQGLLRLSPDQDWRPWHRFQHLYAFPVYSLLTLSWVAYGDFQKLLSGRIGQYRLPKASPLEVATLFLAKIFYFGYMIALPLLFHPVLYVLIAFVGIHLVMGFTLSLTFQLAHTLEGTAFPRPDPETGSIENEWAIHQVETTANFAPKSRLAAWYLGGLNFQIEHHLFSDVCHIHYPAISRIVEKTCGDFSIDYVGYKTLHSAVSAHYRFLKTLGRGPVPLHP
ncbi:MAG: acyl-CoA desaturase [Candidatus Tectomicrobia bacterium]|nr:acyl-CoA desaturase [Candidatus Tectomicrobia bacterium]